MQMHLFLQWTVPVHLAIPLLCRYATQIPFIPRVTPSPLEVIHFHPSFKTPQKWSPESSNPFKNTTHHSKTKQQIGFDVTFQVIE